MASGLNLQATNTTANDSVIQLKNVGTTAGTTVVTVPNRTMTMAGTDDVANASSLLVEFTVTGSAVTSFTISGLDIATHKSYRFEMELVSATATQSDISLYANGDTAATNYYRQLTTFTSTTVSTAITNNAVMMPMKPAISGLSYISGNISLKLGDAVRVRIDSTQSNINDYRTLIYHNVTNANVTSISFASSVASNIGIGTRVRIYRGDV